MSSPLHDSSKSRGCCRLLHLTLVPLGCWLPSQRCWEEQEPWGHREPVVSLVRVWSPLHKAAPEGFCGKGQSLLGRVSVLISCCGCCQLLYREQMPVAQLIAWKLHTAAVAKSDPELSFLQRLFKWKASNSSSSSHNSI